MVRERKAKPAEEEESSTRSLTPWILILAFSFVSFVFVASTFRFGFDE